MDIPSESNKTKRRKRGNTSPPNPPAQPDNAPAPSPPSPPPPADPAQLEDECPQCFLTPCATVSGHNWLGEGQPAHPDNHGIRRIKYKSYWKAINNLGGWLDQRYFEKKLQQEVLFMIKGN